MKWKLCFVFVLVHIEYGTPQSHSPMTPAKGDNKDLAEGEDKNYPSRLEELANSRRQALPMDEEWPDYWSRISTTDLDQGQGVRPKVRTGRPAGLPAGLGQTNRGQNEQNDPWAKELAKQLTGVPYRFQPGQSHLRIQDRDLAKPPIPVVRPIPVIRPRPVVRQNPVSGQKPVATGGNGWQTNQITAQNQNRPMNEWPDYWSNLPKLPAKPARPQHNALRSRSLSTIPEVHEVPQQSWRPQAQSPFSLFHRNGARYFLEQARSQPRRRYPAGTRPILNQVPDVFAKWRNWQKRPQTTE